MWIFWTELVSLACSVDIPPPKPEAWQVVPGDGATGVATGAVVRVLLSGDWAAGPVELGGRLRLVDPSRGEVEVVRSAWNGRVDLAPRTALRRDTEYVVEELVAYLGSERLASVGYGRSTDDRWVPLASFRTGTAATDPPLPEVRVTEVSAYVEDCFGAGAWVGFAVDGADDGTLVELEDQAEGVLASVRLDETVQRDGKRLVGVTGTAASQLRVVLRGPAGERASDWVAVTPRVDWIRGVVGPAMWSSPWGPQGAPTLPTPRDQPACRTLERDAGATDGRWLVALGAVDGEPWYVATDPETRSPWLVSPSAGTELRLDTALLGENSNWEASYDGRIVTLAGFEADQESTRLRAVTVGPDGVVQSDRTLASSVAGAEVVRMSHVGDRVLVVWQAEWHAWATLTGRDGKPSTTDLGRTLQRPVLATGPGGWVVGGLADPEAPEADLWLATIPYRKGEIGFAHIPVGPDDDLVAVGSGPLGEELVLHRPLGAIEVLRWDGAVSDRAVVGHHRFDRSEQIVRAGPGWIVSWTAGSSGEVVRASVLGDDGTAGLPIPLDGLPYTVRTAGLPDGVFGYGMDGWAIWRCADR